MKRLHRAPAVSHTWKCLLHLSAAAITALAILSEGSAQQLIKIRSSWSCNYHGGELHSDVYTFESDQQARAVVSRIVSYTGLALNFDVRAADVPNAAAVLYNDGRRIQRLLLYNQTFMQRLAGVARTDWAATSIMAHEIGHHLQGHTLDFAGSRPDLELQADSYSGYVLQRMGATLSDAQIAMNLVGSDEGSATHPPKRARLAAIASGWTSAKELASGPEVAPRTTRDRFISNFRVLSETSRSTSFEIAYDYSGSEAVSLWIRALFNGEEVPGIIFLSGFDGGTNRYSMSRMDPKAPIQTINGLNVCLQTKGRLSERRDVACEIVPYTRTWRP